MLNLDARELATVVAALRYMRNDMDAEWWNGAEIATPHGNTKPLSAAEIEALCQRLDSPAERLDARA